MSLNLSQLEADWYKAEEEQTRLQNAWVQRRLQMEAQCIGDPEFKATILKLCKDDPLFFFDHFLWTYRPRDQANSMHVPFIPYAYQREAIMWIHDSIQGTRGTAERSNLLIEKSRDMGMSWCLCGYFLWSWLFHNGSFLILSRKEEEVDKKGDMDTPFEKLRYMLRKLPTWMLPTGFDWNSDNKYLLLINPTGGEIAGESANANAGRGGRKLAVLFDEMQVMEHAESAYKACAQTTSVRISIGTPNGPVGKYYRLATAQEGEEEVDKRRYHWSVHPVKAAGMTMHDGKQVSWWYLKQTTGKGAMNAEDAAAELDINYATSVKGIIFPEYSELHKWFIPKVQITPISLKLGEEYAPMLRVWDPGVVCFANMFLQKDKHNRCLALKENLTDHANVHDVALQVQELSNWFDKKLKPKRWDDCGDPAGASRNNSAQEDPEYTILRDQYDIDVDYLFMSEQSSKLRVKARIQAIRNMLRNLCGPAKSPYLVLDVGQCEKLDVALSMQYRWKVDKLTKKVFEGKINEEHPYEDVVDCLGYGIVYWWGLMPKFLGSQSSHSSRSIGASEVEWNY